MIFSLSMLEEHFNQLNTVLFKDGTENGAYLLCRLSHTENEKRLIVKEVIEIDVGHYIKKEKFGLSIKSLSYVSIAKKALLNNYVIVFIHSHPNGYREFSDKDDTEETKLLEFFDKIIPDKPHGTMVLTKDSICGRVKRPYGWEPFDKIRVIGEKFIFFDEKNFSVNNEVFDRQIEAFGEKTQKILHKLHVGVVGAGGTGSSIVEQLTRLGVGEISIFDGDYFDKSNVNRVYGSKILDSNGNKALIAGNNSVKIGLNTKVNVYQKFISEEYIARKMRDCDIVFGCTDTHSSRGILVRLSAYYYIPIFDLAVKINSNNGEISDILARLTLMYPNEACLFCRGRIDVKKIRAESQNITDYNQELADGYAPELETRAPAVIPFTTNIASFAISEFIHKITGFKGEEIKSTEYLISFENNEIRKNRARQVENCICRKNIGMADSGNFLGLVW